VSATIPRSPPAAGPTRSPGCARAIGERVCSGPCSTARPRCMRQDPTVLVLTERLRLEPIAERHGCRARHRP
jgi:hypothetical protein